jgi:biofilm PGA synthesis N-glycosyltransferase PgaC
MMEIIAEMLRTLILLLASPFNHGMMEFALKFIPYVLFLELPLYIFIILGIMRYFIRKDDEIPEQQNY